MDCLDCETGPGCLPGRQLGKYDYVLLYVPYVPIHIIGIIYIVRINPVILRFENTNEIIEGG